MDRLQLERLADALRVELFVAAGLLVSACEREPQWSECHELDGCIVDTTTRGPDPEPDASTETDGGDGTETDDGSDWLEPWQEPYTRTDCVPLQADGTCPASDSSCLNNLMENRHGSGECSCFVGHVFSRVVDGPRPDIDDECCYEIKFSWLWCVAGRPFVVAGDLRRASHVASADWARSMPRVELRVAEREREGQAWLEAARMEHASVAAFARMATQLLGLGAPPSLLTEVLRAQADELVHARLCFTIASELLGRRLGPGPLDVSHAVGGPVDLQATVTALILEGCVGETLAAAQASLAAARTEAPLLAAALEHIHVDETRHARLAVLTLAWLCAHPRHGRPTRAIVARVCRELEASPWPELDPGPGLGGLGSGERRLVSASLRDSVVLPLLRGLACRHAA
ncbi:MAG: ferritin-like domain-containing protein [Enhygromyxa sp.]